MPEDLKLMVSHVRILSYLGRDVVRSLSDVISTVELHTGSYLFRDGDPEEKLFVVKSGRLDLRVTDEDGYTTVIHEVTAGGNPYSLLAIVDAMNNRKTKYHRIEAVAKCRTKVVWLAISDLIKVCRDHPPANLRLAQMIIIRLHRVTFVALHTFFGLDKELFSQEPQTFLKDSAVKALLCKLGDCEGNASNAHSRSSKHGESRGATLMPAGSVDTDHLVPTGSSTRTAGATSSKPKTSPSSHHHHHHHSREKPDPSATAASLEEVNSIASASFPKLLELGESTAMGGTGGESTAPSAMTAETETALVRAAEEDLARLFGIAEGPKAFQVPLEGGGSRSMVRVVEVASGEYIGRETEVQSAFYYILSGGFSITQMSTVAAPGVTKPVTVLRAAPGELVGLMGVVTGEPNNCGARARSPSWVAAVAREDFFGLVRAHPQVLINAANLVSRRLSSLLRLADFALEWHGVDAGKALYKQGDSSNYVYVVLNGRFREVHTYPDASRKVVGESGRGAFLGYVEVTSAKPRMNTVLAIRDSEVVKMPSILLNWLKRLTPHPVSRFIQLLSDRLMQHTPSAAAAAAGPMLGTSFSPSTNTTTVNGAKGGEEGFVPFTATPSTDFPVVLQQSQMNAAGSGGAMTNLRAIAILATSPDIHTEAFTLELQHAMSVFGSTVRLTSDIVKKRLGENAFDSLNDYRLCSWLSHQEDLHRMVFYIADSNSTAWTRRCLRQADCVVLLALASAPDPTKLSPVEQAMSYITTKVTKILVLLYPLETEYPPVKRTAEWLNARPWVTQHYHIRAPPRVLNPTVKNLIAFYSQVFMLEEPSAHSDMSRLARYLCGQAVGLVLGGGGAKGGAHVGVIRVLYEAGVPVDMVGGTSIGALIGAMWSEETRVTGLSQRSRDFAKIFKSVWPKLRDITYPTVSLFSGYEFNSRIKEVFKDRQIEDLWLPYFCVTTDITNCKMRVHTSGSLWRYVRASMSLSGYMPPLCDPQDGSYLLDGGYTNNVPADVMAALGAKTVYAVDVGSVYDTNLTNYGDWLSGWWLIYQRLFRWWGPTIRVPNFSEIQSRLAYISCIRQLEEVKASGICHYLRPPIDRFMTLQFAAFDEIITVGYDYAKEVLSSWYSSGEFNRMIPALYKRSRSASMSTLSGSSSQHRKTRSVSLGAPNNDKVLEHRKPKVEQEEQEGSHTPPTDSAAAAGVEEPVKRRRGSLENLFHRRSESHTRPDFDGEWCKTWLRLHPERITHLAMGSTAFDKPEDTNALSMAEQWLYAPNNASTRNKRRRHLGRQDALSRSATLDGFGRPSAKQFGTSDEESDSEAEGANHRYQQAERTKMKRGGEGRRHQYQKSAAASKAPSRGNASSENDEFLVTASDPELSSLRFAPPSPKAKKPTTAAAATAPSSSGKMRRASLTEAVPPERSMMRRVANFDDEEDEAMEEEEDEEVEVVKPSRHKLHTKSSLDRLSGQRTSRGSTKVHRGSKPSQSRTSPKNRRL